MITALSVLAAFASRWEPALPHSQQMPPSSLMLGAGWCHQAMLALLPPSLSQGLRCAQPSLSSAQTHAVCLGIMKHALLCWHHLATWALFAFAFM